MHGARNESQSKIGPPSCLKSNTSKSITENAETILKMKDNLDWHDFVEQLQLNLQCPVCYDPPYQPYTLECGHLFCAKCLMEARPQTEKSDTGFRCPLCNVPTTRTPHPVHAVRHCLEIMANGAGKTMPMPVVWSWEPMRPRPRPLTARSSQNLRSGSA
ncbi:hypothetical protein GYMLUDRAFT_253595 [Collybiopsis luxurians FD-317 M1]|uniref:RING-type domain-containing protein n=1 Tax=Collybiopsis luxurians FD-317 M1 TaxID=944289 RepID=A0A0D0C4P4_9AGAR|nr:hypothetical protein GYMLUDRAFT_253595 [Collybiopsis luxurians FD-317 M1]